MMVELFLFKVECLETAVETVDFVRYFHDGSGSQGRRMRNPADGAEAAEAAEAAEWNIEVDAMDDADGGAVAGLEGTSSHRAKRDRTPWLSSVVTTHSGPGHHESLALVAQVGVRLSRTLQVCS